VIAKVHGGARFVFNMLEPADDVGTNFAAIVNSLSWQWQPATRNPRALAIAVS
jgi:hypothetical protein